MQVPTISLGTLLKRIVSLPENVQRSYDVSSMHSIVVAAAPCPFEVKRRVMDLFGPVLYEFYGASETGVNTLMRPEEQLTKPGSCGKVVDGVDMKILDDQGNECALGIPGEIWVKTESLITEYYNNPKATSDARRGDYFSVGDIAYRDEDGVLSLRSATCTHMGCQVGWNPAERTWDCPCHGSRFTARGEVFAGPAESALAPVEP